MSSWNEIAVCGILNPEGQGKILLIFNTIFYDNFRRLILSLNSNIGNTVQFPYLPLGISELRKGVGDDNY